ncbi:MAG: hypothetical protein HOY79_17575 [Streptomyces sp.]|nr:hypothetical protein [Streptomyces sp.]
MTTRHLTPAGSCLRSHDETDTGPSVSALPRRVPGAALARLKVLAAFDALAVFIGATDVRTVQRMPSRAEWEAAAAGLLTLAGEVGVDA